MITSEDMDTTDLVDLESEISEIVKIHESNLIKMVADLRVKGKDEAWIEVIIGPLIDDCLNLCERLKNAQWRLSKVERNATKIREIFTRVGAIFGPLVKHSAALYFLLARHSPTLRGTPAATHPDQAHTEEGRYKNITTDYLRAACRLSVPGTSSEIMWHRHDVLDSFADKLFKMLYDAIPPDSTALAFNSALGGLKTVRNIMEAGALADGRRLIAHRNAWVEMAADIQWSNLGIYDIVDFTDGSLLAQTLYRPDVSGLIIEPICNHPLMSKTDLRALIDVLVAANKPFTHPTYLVVDATHTPEINSLGMFESALPHNLCICEVVSTVKFLQAGWDVSKGGVLFFRHDAAAWTGQDLLDSLLRFRENSTTGPSFEEAYLMYTETRKSYCSRMARYDRNVRFFENFLRIALVDHERCEVRYVEGSRLVYLSLGSELELVQRVYGEMLRLAETNSIPLMDSSSFGMCTPHLHLVLHPVEGPAIRLSPGSINHSTVEALGFVIVDAVTQALTGS